MEPYTKRTVKYTEVSRHLRVLPTRLLGIIYKCVYTIHTTQAYLALNQKTRQPKHQIRQPKHQVCRPKHQVRHCAIPIEKSPSMPTKTPSYLRCFVARQFLSWIYTLFWHTIFKCVGVQTMTNIKYADNPSSNLDSEEYWEWVAMVWGGSGVLWYP